MSRPLAYLGRIRTCVLSGALLAVAGGAIAASVTFDVASGASVSDRISITARVTGFETTGVRKVEFLLDGRLQGEDGSVPYVFVWDTLASSEGEHVIEAVATDMDGAIARGTLRVVVDNELSRGADYHAGVALEAAKAGDRERAERYARRAVKIDPTNLKAAMALSAVYRSTRDYDKAIAVLEQAGIPAGAAEARRALAELYILRGDAGETHEALIDGLTSALAQNELLVKEQAAARDLSAQAKGDLAFTHRRWPDAISAYQSAGSPSTMPIEIVNRLLLAYANAGRTRDFDLLMRTVTRERNGGDGITRVVEGAQHLLRHRPEEARRTVQSGVEDGIPGALIVAATADLITGETKRAADEIEQLHRRLPDAQATLYLRTFVVTEPMDLRPLFLRAIGADLSNPEPLLRKAYDVLLSKRPDRIKEAQAFLNLARSIAPDSPDVLMVSAAFLLFDRRAEEAEPLLKQVLEKDPDAPDALVGLGLCYSLLDRTREITPLLDKAMKIDDARWNDVYVPKPVDFVTRVMKYRVAALVSPKILYPTP